MSPTDHDISAAWIECARELHGARIDALEKSPNFWAFEAMTKIAAEEPERALDIILMIMSRYSRRRGQGFGVPGQLRLEDDDHVLATLAAGPLEDVLVNHGARVLNRINALCREDPRFRELAAGVWPRDEMPGEVTALLAAAREQGY